MSSPLFIYAAVSRRLSRRPAARFCRSAAAAAAAARAAGRAARRTTSPARCRRRSTGPRSSASLDKVSCAHAQLRKALNLGVLVSAAPKIPELAGTTAAPKKAQVGDSVSAC